MLGGTHFTAGWMNDPCLPLTKMRHAIQSELFGCPKALSMFYRLLSYFTVLYNSTLG